MHIFKSLAAGLFALCCFANLSAVQVPDQLNLSGGYRNDVISAHTTITEPSGFTTVDRLRFDNIDLGVVGLEYRFTLPQCDRCCEHPFLRNFYVDGYAYWGWSESDDFARNVNEGFEDANTTFISTGHQKARTEDFQIALGYLVYNCDCWAVGLKGGYAYNYQRVRTSSGSTAVEAGPATADPVYSGLVLKQRWQGPWLGAEVFFSTCCDVLVNIGYEYHFAHYHALFDVPAATEAGLANFTNKKSAHSAYGNVGYINAHYSLCDCWDVGLGFTYKLYRTRHTSVSPVGGFVAAGFPEGTTGSARSKWISYSILADVGYTF